MSSDDVPDPRANRIAMNERHAWWLIGCVLAQPELMAEAADLDAEDLPQWDQRIWWRAMQRIHADGRRPDMMALTEAFAADGVLEDQHGPGEIIRRADEAPYLQHIDEWVPEIRREAARRRLDIEAVTIRRMITDDTIGNEEIAARLAAAESILATGRPASFRTMTSAELDAADLSTEYLVSDVMARCQSTIIAAAKKSLKTNIAIDLTLSLASRCAFLGKFYVPRAVRVALMSGESGDATIQETARRIARSKSWPNLSDYENVVWSFDLPRLGQPQTRRELTGFIRDNGLEVLIVDPAYLCMDLGDGAGNIFSVGPKLRELTDIQHDTGCTLVIIHHNNKSKGDPFAVPELESIAWSGFQEWARQWLLIGRREAYNPEQSGSHKLWFSVGGSAGHSGLFGLDIEEGSRKDSGGRRWEVSIDGASKVVAQDINQTDTEKQERARLKDEKTLAADVAKMLEQYRKRPDGETEKYCRERCRLSGARAGAASDKLMADGLIVPCEVVKFGRSFPAFKPSGLIGTDRDSTGTISACPDGSTERDYLPYGGSPDPDHRDSHNSLSEAAVGISPDAETVNELFGGGRPA